MQAFSIIVAMDKARGIGKKGTLPWHLPGDLNHFKTLSCTTEADDKQNAVIMGRRTWESIPERFRPLPDRINIVLSRNKKLILPDGVFSAQGLAEAFFLLDKPPLKGRAEKIFVIGGAQIFECALTSPSCEKLHVTHIEKQFQCDTFFPPFESEFEIVKRSDRREENGIPYYFSDYKRHRH